jgi:hypothetical protein
MIDWFLSRFHNPKSPESFFIIPKRQTSVNGSLAVAFIP